ncbi:MAG: hypothetical protein IPM88_19925 [Nitrospira sp.]|nr:hypothetical protein [Nitrospira sp.]
MKELYAEEFQQLVERYFTHVAILGQRVLYASAILPSGRPGESIHYHREHGAGIQSAHGLMRPCYQVAVASDAAMPSLAGSLFEETADRPGKSIALYLLDHARQRIAGFGG